MNIIPLSFLLVSHQAGAIKVTPSKTLDGLHVVSIAPAPVGSRIVVGLEDGSVRIMDAATKSTIRPLTKHLQPCYAVSWSPDGRFIATGDETARIFIEDASTGKKIREYRTHTKGIQKLSFNVTSKLLASTGKDDQVNVYNLTSPKPKEARVILGKGMNFYGATFNPTSANLVSVGMLGGGVRVYDAFTGSVKSFYTDKDGQGIFDMCFNSSGSRAVSSGRDGNAIVWDTVKCAKVLSLKGHSDWVVNGAVSPNGKLVATSSSDRTVRIWNLYSGQTVAKLDGEMGVGSPLAFTVDGASLVSVNDAGDIQFNSVSPAQAGSEPTAKPAKKKRRRRG